MIVITKASDDSYYDFIDDNKSIIELFDELENSYIVTDNTLFGEKPEALCRWNGIPMEVAEKLSKSKINVIIYDDYVE